MNEEILDKVRRQFENLPSDMLVEALRQPDTRGQSIGIRLTPMENEFLDIIKEKMNINHTTVVRIALYLLLGDALKTVNRQQQSMKQAA